MFFNIYPLFLKSDYKSEVVMIIQSNAAQETAGKVVTSSVNTADKNPETTAVNQASTDEAGKSIFEYENIKAHRKNNAVNHEYTHKDTAEKKNKTDSLLEKLIELLEKLLKEDKTEEKKNAEKADSNDESAKTQTSLVQLLQRLIQLLLGKDDEKTDKSSDKEIKTLMSQLKEVLA